MNAQEAIAKATLNGWVEISSGVYLNSQTSIVADQEGWDEMDESKLHDFTKAPFWITTDNGLDPVGIFAADDMELAEILNS